MSAQPALPKNPAGCAAIRCLAVAFAFGSIAAPNSAAAKEKAVTSATAQAIIVARLSFIKTQDLDFGKIIAGTTAGTVTVSPTGARTASGGVRVAGGTAQPASFSGFGFQNQTVLISIPSASFLLRRIGGTESMTMDAIVIGSTPAVQLATAPLSFRIVSSTGQFAFPAGATLHVGARQAAGKYAGTFSIILQYQ